MFIRILFIFVGFFIQVCVFSQIDLSTSSWKQTDHVAGVPVRKLVLQKGKLFSGTGGNGMYTSDDGGDNWISVLSALPAYEITDILVGKGNNIYATTAKNGVFQSQNRGDTWQQINDGLMFTGVNCIALKGNRLYIGTIDGLFTKKKNDSNWERIKLPLQNTGRGNNIVSIAITKRGIVAGGTSVVFTSDKKVENWMVLEDGLLTNVRSIHLENEEVLIGTTGDGLFRLDATHTSLLEDTTQTVNFENVIVNNFFTEGGTTVVLSAQYGIVDQDGSSLNDGLGSSKTLDLVRYDNNKYLVSTAANGVFILETDNNKSGTSEQSAEPVQSTAELVDTVMVNVLLRVYPNPSSGQITVEVFIPEDGNIVLQLMSIDGRYDKMLFTARSVDKGLWRRTFEVGQVTPGEYFIVATSNQHRTSTPVSFH